MAKFNMKTLEIIFTLHPDTGEWIVVNGYINGHDRRKTFEKFDDAAVHIWNLIHEHARTAEVREAERTDG